MTLILRQFFGLIQLLHSDTGAIQMAAGVTCGFILGMTPTLSLQSFLIFMGLFIFRIQIGAALISTFFFSLIAYLLDPIFHRTGLFILNMETFEGIFISLYNMPFIPYTRFNNTIVMGSGIVAIALSPLIFFLAKKLIEKYRVKVVEKFKQTKFWKAIKATSLFEWYCKYDQLYDVD